MMDELPWRLKSQVLGHIEPERADPEAERRAEQDAQESKRRSDEQVMHIEAAIRSAAESVIVEPPVRRTESVPDGPRHPADTRPPPSSAWALVRAISYVLAVLLAGSFASAGLWRAALVIVGLATLVATLTKLGKRLDTADESSTLTEHPE